MNEVFPEDTTGAQAKDSGDEAPFVVKRPSVFLRQITAYTNVLEQFDDVCKFAIIS
jgi:hypothetical protein